VPDAVFDTPEGKVGVALASSTMSVFAHGRWRQVAAPGFVPGVGKAHFEAPNRGWLVGRNAIGRITPKPAAPALAEWPQANRSTLTGIALPPGANAAVGAAGAVAVGLDGTALHYDPSAGWLVDATPSRARRITLRSVAFNGPNSAFAVGQLGTILRWDGTGWSEDPQSVAVTQSQLNSVAFKPNGEGWAVGAFGTILHFDGQTWSTEHPPAEDADVNISSVAVAGGDVFAIAGGTLLQRVGNREWKRVPDSELPSPLPPAGDLRLLSGLPDGGLVVAGRTEMMQRTGPGKPFEYSSQPLGGIAVALSAFRTSRGNLGAFASVAPSVRGIGGSDTKDVAGFPPGDGELMRLDDNGWQDLSRAQFPGESAAGDGVLKEDPVLAVATNRSGTSAWAVGGYAGTQSAADLGTLVPLAARPPGWRTSQIWRYDVDGPAQSPGLSQARVELPGKAKTVTFAFFSAPLCKIQCSAVRDAQPDTNLRGAAQQIARFAEQPGGPAFAVLGGNARGPIADVAYENGTAEDDFAQLPDLLAPLGSVPLFAAYGPRDPVPTKAEPAQPWADALARGAAPFGSGPPPPGITPVSSGAAIGSVHRYYAFDAAQNGGVLRVIVLDDSATTLENSSHGQSEWLDRQLADAQASSKPVVVIAGNPIRNAAGTGGGDALARKLVDAGVLAVFTTAGQDYTSQVNRVRMIPDNLDPTHPIPQIPEYEGATLGYQQDANNGVLWYQVAVDVAARKVSVQGIPLMESLALKPRSGLVVERSGTLQFEAIGRRPKGSLATYIGDERFPGYDNYVSIPAANCSGCIGPSYRFTSADRTIGDFVIPSGPGSRYPKLDSNGKPIPSASSGLFCGYNTGQTTITVTSGLLAASLPVTVLPGQIGRPCGTVFRPGVQQVVIVPNSKNQVSSAAPGGAAAPPPNPAPSSNPLPATLPKIALPLPPLAPRVEPAPKPHPRVVAPAPPPFEPAPVPTLAPPPLTPVLAIPPVPPAAQPIPPGGAATSSSTAAAKRREKVRKHARQSAYVIRPTDVAAADWFYPAVGVVSVLAMLLVASGTRGGRTRRPQYALLVFDHEREGLSAPTGRRRT
jgi:photosystem II stability/assembly factor-like uncharacterized protein